LLWGGAGQGAGENVPRWLANAKRFRDPRAWRQAAPYWWQQFVAWYEGTTQNRDSRVHLEILFWLAMLPGYLEAWPEDALHRLIERVAPALNSDEPGMQEDHLWHKHLIHEARATLACLFPTLPAVSNWWEEAQKVFHATLEVWARKQDSSGQNGTVCASALPLMWRLLAVWTRSQSVASGCGRSLFPPAVQEQIGQVLLDAMRWARHDGSQTLDEGARARWTKSLVRCVFQVFPEIRCLAPLARRALKKSCAPKRWGKIKTRGLPPASRIDEKGRWCLLRSNWAPKSAVFAAAFPSSGAQAELRLRNHTLLCGEMSTTIFWNGATLKLQGEPELVCEFLDKRMQYAEWQFELGEGCYLQRQIALAPRDAFLLLADAVISRRGESASWRYELRWQLATGVTFILAKDTQEGWLYHLGGERVLVLPVALPEWRTGPRIGELNSQSGQLTYRVQGTGRAFMTPLFFDLSEVGHGSAFTWRRLTVGQDRRRVPCDVACGYRIQIGPNQWIVYRALLGCVPRTVIGQHWASEFVIARFQPSGQCRPLLEVETAGE